MSRRNFTISFKYDPSYHSKPEQAAKQESQKPKDCHFPVGVRHNTCLIGFDFGLMTQFITSPI